MMRMLWTLLWLAAAPALAAPGRDLAGRWTLTSADRPLLILTVARDPAAPRGWRVREEAWRGDLHSDGTADHLRPERRTSGYTVVASQPDALTLRAAGGPEDGRTFTFHPLADGVAEWLPEGASASFVYRRATGPVALARGFDPARVYPLDRPYPDNAEMRAIFTADQAARAAPSIDWAVVGPQDAARLARARALLDAGALHSGSDYWEAAFLFQHSGRPDDYLTAHALAVIAAARGRPDASWIAAATLDRYLQSIGRKQVYGTQFMVPNGGGPVTQEPYDRALLTDALRRASGVPDQAQQAERRKALERPAPAGGQ